VSGPLRIALVAGEAAGIQVLRRILASPHELVAVLADERGGATATVAGAARAAGLAVSPPEGVRSPELASRLRAEGVDLLLNVHSLAVVHPEVLAAPGIGSFNLHPGPLPELAGLNAPSWAVYRRAERHAVTLHWMTEAVDAGPIAYRAEVPVDAGETGLSLSLKCVRAGVPLVERLLSDAAASAAGVPVLPQEGPTLFLGAGPPHEGRIRWELPAEELEAFVRACDFRPFASPWGRPRAGEIGIVSAHATSDVAREPPGTVGRAVGGGVLVAAGDRWLRVELVEAEGRVRPAAELLAQGARLASPAAAGGGPDRSGS
jgi:methionyl-tRNA formyltransferase